MTKQAARLDTLVKTMNDIMEQFKIDSAKTSNKAAAKRCRKYTMNLQRLGKEYRALSMHI